MPVQTQMQVRRGTASSWTSTNPTLAAGELGFETDTGKFKIGTGASTWTALPYAGGGQNTLTTYQYTATAGQTTFSGADVNSNTLAYTAGAVQIYLNGALLANTTDYAASTGTSVVLTAGAGLGDSLTILSLGSFTVSTDIPKSTLTAKGSIVAASAASTPANLSVGANNTVLTADSSTATGLKWATPSASAPVWSLLSTTTTNTGTSYNITGLSGYNQFLFRFSLIKGSNTNSGDFHLNFNSVTTGNKYVQNRVAIEGGTAYTNSFPSSADLTNDFLELGGYGTASGPDASGFLFLQGGNGAGLKVGQYQFGGNNNNTNASFRTGTFIFDDTNVISSMQIEIQSGFTFTSGTIRIYGSVV